MDADRLPEMPSSECRVISLRVASCGSLSTLSFRLRMALDPVSRAARRRFNRSLAKNPIRD